MRALFTLVRVMEQKEAFALGEALTRVDGVKHISKETGGPGSTRNEPLRYSVLTGEVLDAQAGSVPACQAILDAYQRIVELAREEGLDVEQSPHRPSAINVNLLYEKGDGYQWHLDSNPYSAVLFLGTREVGDAHVLMIDPVTDTHVAVACQAGACLIFDAANIEHCVTQLTTPGPRVSVVYDLKPYTAQRGQRVEGLDAYLFDTEFAGTS